MKRIIIHWTAGGNKPNSVDLEHYHFVIDSKGVIYNGKYKPEDNENCKDGRYAQHTGGGNTGSIGVSMCGMAGYSNPREVGKYPLTAVQVEKMFKFCSDLAQKYKIPITSSTIMTHYEFGQKNPKTTSAGKIDIVFLPPFPGIPKDKIGDFIRAKIRWYSEKS